ncbi:hypothetical protein Ntsu_80510 [Nocardia sp. IFM 10818]
MIVSASGTHCAGLAGAAGAGLGAVNPGFEPLGAARPGCPGAAFAAPAPTASTVGKAASTVNVRFVLISLPFFEKGRGPRYQK